jgi:hypothetical protein
MQERGGAVALMTALAALCMGAEGRSCSAEVESRGEAQAWEFSPIPAESAAQPLTCEVLDAGTCWSELVSEMQRCVPPGEVGRFSEDRTRCAFPDGTLIEWDGDVERPEPGETSLSIIQHRVLTSRGEPCLTGRWLGIAHAAFDVGGEVAVLRGDSLTAFTLICPDGATYANDVEGTCEDTGARWLVGGLPGYDVFCDGERNACGVR